MKKLLVILFVVVFVPVANAGPQKALKKGYVLNDEGSKCWYSQNFDDGVKYFHRSLTQNIGTIIFDNPLCMFDSGLGLDANKMMINNVISRWYSHSDANFRTITDEMFEKSSGQVKGLCIQSDTYSSRGIAVDYKVRDGSIYKVVHGDTVGGCIK